MQQPPLFADSRFKGKGLSFAKPRRSQDRHHRPEGGETKLREKEIKRFREKSQLVTVKTTMKRTRPKNFRTRFMRLYSTETAHHIDAFLDEPLCLCRGEKKLAPVPFQLRFALIRLVQAYRRFYKARARDELNTNRRLLIDRGVVHFCCRCFIVDFGCINFSPFSSCR